MRPFLALVAALAPAVSAHAPASRPDLPAITAANRARRRSTGWSEQCSGRARVELVFARRAFTDVEHLEWSDSRHGAAQASGAAAAIGRARAQLARLLAE